MLGGYKVLDFKGMDLNSTQNIPGTYSALEASIGKPILVRNFKKDSLEIPAFFTTPFFEGDSLFLMRTVTSTQIHRVIVTATDNIAYQIRNLGTSSPSGNPTEDEPTASM